MAKSSKSKPSRNPVAPRNTFRLAKAVEEARIALPDTLFNPKATRSDNAASKRRLSLQDVPADYRDRGQAPAPPAPIKKAPRPEPGLAVTDKRRDEQLSGCKRRPSNHKGSGNGRAFVPWCSK